MGSAPQRRRVKRSRCSGRCAVSRYTAARRAEPRRRADRLERSCEHCGTSHGCNGSSVGDDRSDRLTVSVRCTARQTSPRLRSTSRAACSSISWTVTVLSGRPVSIASAMSLAASSPPLYSTTTTNHLARGLSWLVKSSALLVRRPPPGARCRMERRSNRLAAGLLDFFQPVEVTAWPSLFFARRVSVAIQVLRRR